MSKFLILTGCSIDGSIDMCSHEEPRKKIEVVDVQNPLNSCSLPWKFPLSLRNAVGGFTKDGPLLCTGYSPDIYKYKSNDCFILGKTRFLNTDVKLQTERDKATAVVLPNGELWIQGGSKGNRLKSIEVLSLQGSEYGMELEIAVSDHCSMLINSTTIFITGGNIGGSITSETYFVDIHNLISSKGPNMKEVRRSHGCAVFRHNNHKYAVVAGNLFGPLSSSMEILDLDSQILEWTKGKSSNSTSTIKNCKLIVEF